MKDKGNKRKDNQFSNNVYYNVKGNLQYVNKHHH